MLPKLRFLGYRQVYFRDFIVCIRTTTADSHEVVQPTCFPTAVLYYYTHTKHMVFSREVRL